MSIFKKIYHRIRHNVTRRRRNRRWLAFTLFFRNIAGNLSGFYKPLFFYQAAQMLNFWPADYTDLQKGMVAIGFYYLGQRVVSFIINFVQAQLTLKIGHDRSLLLGNLFRTLWLLSLTYVDVSPWFLIIATVLAGIETGFFNQSYHTLICRLSLEEEMGKSLGASKFLGNFISMLTPFLGGVIISHFGFNYLFYSSILLILVSIGGLLKLEIPAEKDKVNLQEYLSWVKEKRYNRLMLSQMGRYFYDISLVLWPLFVFLIIDDVVRVGSIYTISLFFAMLTSLFTGHYLDKKKQPRLPFLVSGGILSTISMFRLLVTGAWDIIIIDCSNRILGDFYWLVHEKFIFIRGRGSQDFSYFVYREVNRSLAAVLFWSAAALFFVFKLDWLGLFALGSLGILMSMLAKQNKGKLND